MFQFSRSLGPFLRVQVGEADGGGLENSARPYGLSKFLAHNRLGIGSYLIAHNSIDCGWAHPHAEGIGVFSQIEEWPTERAIVVDNDVTMLEPEGTVFDEQSAGIAIRGFTQGNLVLNKRIRGRARAALSVFSRFEGAIPANNTFVLNRLDDFEPSVAYVFVGKGVINTLIVGPGTIEDHGVGTVIVPMP